MKTALMISTYNWPQALELCLMSVLNQTSLPHEILIGDDGSGPETASKILKLKPLFTKKKIIIKHIWHKDTGFRLAKIRNKCIEKCESEYIIQIDGDIILDKNFIFDHCKYSKNNCAIFGSRILLNKLITEKLLSSLKLNKVQFFINCSNKINMFRSLKINSLIYRKLYSNKNMKLSGIRGCNMSFWKKDLLSVNGYNEDIEGWGMEDSELVMRLYKQDKVMRKLKFGANAYHLYHKINDQSKISKNNDILLRTKKNITGVCKNGIKKIS